jgi:MFS family permease
MVVGGLVIPIVIGFFLHLVSGTFLLAVSGIGWVVCALLFAIMPVGASYWAFAFPAMICATLGIDITFNITNIFITTNLPRKRQGLAGALINSILHLSIATLLGFADLAQIQTSHLGRRQSYKVVFWFHVACSGLSLLIMVLFVRVNPAKSELTVDERQQMEAAPRQARPSDEAK